MNARLIKPSSFRTRMVLYFASLIIVVFTVGNSLLYFYMTAFTEKLVSEYTLEAIKQTSGKLDSELYQIEVLSKQIISNKNVQEILEELPDDLSDYKKRAGVLNYFYSLTLPSDNIAVIYILQGSRTILSFNVNPTGHDDIQQILTKKKLFSKDERSGGVIFTAPIEKQGPEKDYTIAASMDIYDLVNFKQIGNVVVELKYKMLSGILESFDIGNDGTIFLVNESGNILFSSNREKINNMLDPIYWGKLCAEPELKQKQIIGRDMFINYYKSPYTGWYILAEIPLKKAFAPIRQVQAYFAAVSLAGIFLVLLMAFFLSRSFSRPLTELVNKMKGVKQGNLMVQVKQSSYNEIQELNNSFNDMMASLNQMIREVYEAKIGQKEAELKSLRAQINPHFLYNTLDVINWMAIVREQDVIAQLVRALSNLLRYNISNGDEPVGVHEEITQLCNYMDIQKARFGSKFEYEVDIEPNAMVCKIRKFLLQPIVENAIVHGLKNPQNGKIVIKGNVSGDYLIIKVEDNGIGMDEKTLSGLLVESGVITDDTSGIGLRNISRQIGLYYGEDYGLKIKSELEKGTVVEIVLPAIFA